MFEIFSGASGSQSLSSSFQLNQESSQPQPLLFSQQIALDSTSSPHHLLFFQFPFAISDKPILDGIRLG